jgi:hypothetical protein
MGVAGNQASHNKLVAILKLYGQIPADASAPTGLAFMTPEVVESRGKSMGGVTWLSSKTTSYGGNLGQKNRLIPSHSLVFVRRG